MSNNKNKQFATLAILISNLSVHTNYVTLQKENKQNSILWGKRDRPYLKPTD